MNEDRLMKILFAEFLNQNGCDTGVDTEKLLRKELNITSKEEFKIIPLSDKDGNDWNGIYSDKTGFITTKLQGNCKAICDKLNELTIENKNLKAEIQQLKTIKKQKWYNHYDCKHFKAYPDHDFYCKYKKEFFWIIEETPTCEHYDEIDDPIDPH